MDINTVPIYTNAKMNQMTAEVSKLLIRSPFAAAVTSTPRSGLCPESKKLSVSGTSRSVCGGVASFCLVLAGVSTTLILSIAEAAFDVVGTSLSIWWTLYFWLRKSAKVVAKHQILQGEDLAFVFVHCDLYYG
uniref:Uncharacterized protein n=1 Tax=Romanomermis culicivorax TaxID=13658 RepID=A0A915KTT2_ROMCU